MFDEQNTVTESAAITVYSANRFNPFTETPRECPQFTPNATCIAQGFNWKKNDTFGTPTSVASYQLPLTYRFSVGLRF